MVVGYDLADALVAGRLEYSLASLKAAISSNQTWLQKVVSLLMAAKH